MSLDFSLAYMGALHATVLLHRGVPIQNIKKLPHHWSVFETEIYASDKSGHMYPDVATLDNLLL